MRHIKRHLSVISIFIVWALVSVARLKFNGLIFGLDYGLYQPDGAHYTFRTLNLIGYNQYSAAQEVSNWYKAHSFKMNYISPQSLIPISNDAWGLVSPRLLYPILSMPFVLVLGIPGMLVVPAVSLLTAITASFFLLRQFMDEKFALGISLVYLLSITVTRWCYTNCTDSLLFGLFALLPNILSKSISRKYLRIVLIILVLLTSLTRICLPIWIAISLVLWLTKKHFESCLVMFSSVLSAVPAILLQPKNSILPEAGDISFCQKLLQIPLSYLRIGFFELAELFVLDRVLLILLILGIVGALANIELESSKFFVGVLISVWTIGAINGVVGVNFRYQLPIIPFVFWVLSDSIMKKRQFSIIQSE